VELERGMTNVPYAKTAGRQGRNPEGPIEDVGGDSCGHPWMFTQTPSFRRSRWASSRGTLLTPTGHDMLRLARWQPFAVDEHPCRRDAFCGGLDVRGVSWEREILR